MASFIENCSGRIVDHVDMLHTVGWIVGVARFRGDIVRIAIDEKVSVAPISNTIVKLAVCCLFLARPRLRPASGIRQFDTAGRGAAGSAASLMAGPKF
jgi:hypothetical protein